MLSKEDALILVRVEVGPNLSKKIKRRKGVLKNLQYIQFVTLVMRSSC